MHMLSRKARCLTIRYYSLVASQCPRHESIRANLFSSSNARPLPCAAIWQRCLAAQQGTLRVFEGHCTAVCTTGHLVALGELGAGINNVTVEGQVGHRSTAASYIIAIAAGRPQVSRTWISMPQVRFTARMQPHLCCRVRCALKALKALWMLCGCSAGPCRGRRAQDPGAGGTAAGVRGHRGAGSGGGERGCIGWLWAAVWPACCCGGGGGGWGCRRCCVQVRQFKDMFMTSLCQQYASHTLASWAY